MSVPYFPPSFARNFMIWLYAGIDVENVLYGVELLIYFKTIRTLLNNKGSQKKSNIFYALFSSMMIFLITVWIVTNMVVGHTVWLSDSELPGGPFWEMNISVWYLDWARIGVVVLQLMTDGLMIHRCRIIWNSYRLVILPIIVWMGTLGIGVVVAWGNGLPAGRVPVAFVNSISLAYWTISAALHTTLTCMICYRVVRHGALIRKHLGNEHASFYFALVTVVVESVLPYTLSSLAFLVSYGIRSPTYIGFVCVYFTMMCISPQLLILRVVSGTAWDNDTFSRPRSSIRFDHGRGDMTMAQMLESNRARVHVQALPSLPVSHESTKAPTFEVTV